MSSLVLLDATPLGMLANPRARASAEEWVTSVAAGGAIVVMPEIAYFEVRRELLRARLSESVALLDGLVGPLRYAPITTSIIVRASELWAVARQRGQPTADPHELDADVILAATALELASQTSDVIVATSNVGHLAQFVDARAWQTITP